MNSRKRLTRLACLLAAALALHLLEAQLPPLVPLPGIKLGLANIVTLVAFAMFGAGGAAELLLLRIVLGSLMAGSGAGILYSLAGGAVCYGVTAALYPILSRRLWMLSVFGAVGHQLGQLGMAAAVLQSGSVMVYLPPLLAAAVVTGCFTGLCAQLCLHRLWRKES